MRNTKLSATATLPPKVKVMPTKSNTPATPATPAPVTCNLCGKTLKKGATVKAGIGATCAHNAQLRTPAQWQQHYAKHTSATVPKGFIKLATFKQIVPANVSKIAGLTVSKVVKAIGKDKVASAPLHPICTPVYVNNVRYVNPWLSTPAGLTAIATGNFAKAPAK